jgi:hypothetical protein
MKFSRNKKISALTDLNAGKYTVIFFRLISGKYTVIDTIKINIKEKLFRYKNKDFLNFNMNTPLFADTKFNYFGFDYDSGKQLSFNLSELSNKISLEEIDRYVNQGLISQLAHSLEKPKSDKTQWVWLIMGIVVGICIGFVIGNVIGSGSYNVQMALMVRQIC